MLQFLQRSGCFTLPTFFPFREVLLECLQSSIIQAAFTVPLAKPDLVEVSCVEHLHLYVSGLKDQSRFYCFLHKTVLCRGSAGWGEEELWFRTCSTQAVVILALCTVLG